MVPIGSDCGQVPGTEYKDPAERTLPTLLAVPSPEFGSNSDDPYGEALQIAKRAAADCHKVSQLKLLLRGEPGLSHRLVKYGHDTKRCRAVLLDLTQRYGMTRQSQTLEQRPASSGNVSTQQSKDDWRTVPSTSTPKKTPQPVRHALLKEDWSAPIQTDLNFATEGRLLC